MELRYRGFGGLHTFYDKATDTLAINVPNSANEWFESKKWIKLEPKKSYYNYRSDCKEYETRIIDTYLYQISAAHYFTEKCGLAVNLFEFIILYCDEFLSRHKSLRDVIIEKAIEISNDQQLKNEFLPLIKTCEYTIQHLKNLK